MISRHTNDRSGELDRKQAGDASRMQALPRDAAVDTRAGRTSDATGELDEEEQRGLATRYVVPNAIDRPQQES